MTDIPNMLVWGNPKSGYHLVLPPSQTKTLCDGGPPLDEEVEGHIGQPTCTTCIRIWRGQQNVEDTALAQHAYHAYGNVTDFKNYQGLPMPKWEELTPRIQQAWREAARAAVSKAQGDEGTI